VHGFLSVVVVVVTSVVFMWVPCLVGLAGNSVVDNAAKGALLMSILSFPHSDYKSLIRM